MRERAPAIVAVVMEMLAHVHVLVNVQFRSTAVVAWQALSV